MERQEDRPRRGTQAGRDAAEEPRGRGKGERREERIRRGHDTTLLNVVASRPKPRALVVEPTLSRALCPVLVGISGAPTGPSAVSPII